MNANPQHVMSLGVDQKITARHRERLAVVYVRQSSVDQVRRHQESTQMQYNLRELAQRLGWPTARVLVIDDDLGLSGASAQNRAGFQRLLSEVALDHVGLILGVEMSRLARSCKDWYQLLELCAIYGTLICDLDGLYDPSTYNDRLLLGLKGTMSEAELHILQQRMLQGARQKARRGELISRLPIGYTRDVTGHVMLDPDEQVRGIIIFIFDLYERIGTVAGVLKRLRAEGVQLGVRVEGGPDRGQVQWRRPNYATLRGMLANPMYAGAYAYGRRGQRKRPDGQRGQRLWRPVEQWHVLIRDRYPAYITWAQHQANLKQMQANRSSMASRGVSRRGRALLAGLVVCGRCGHRLMTRYAGKASQPRYCCEANKSAYGEEACQGLTAETLDREVVRLALLALAPSSLEVSLQVASDLQTQQIQSDRRWKQRLERVAQQADRARRQYEAVEPENRLVERTLESQWEQVLQEQQQLLEEYQRYQPHRPQLLTDDQQQAIRQLANDLPALWQASTTTDQDRKTILRQIIETVTIQCEGQTQWAEAWILWAGGEQTYTRFRRPVARMEQLAEYQDIHQMILTQHAQSMRSTQIAETLNAAGYRSTNTRPFTAETVRSWLSRSAKPATCSTSLALKPNEWLIPDLVRHLNVHHSTVHGWISKGRIQAHRSEDSGRRWIVQASSKQLQTLMQYREIRAQRRQRRQANSPSPQQPTTVRTVTGGAL